MGTGQTVHSRCLQSPGSQQEAQRGRVTCPRSHSMAARQGPRAGPPRRRRLESGACQGEGRSGPVSSRQREIPHVRRSRHRRGRRPRSHRAVLHDLISWLSPSAVPGAWNQYLLAGPEAPVSSCRPLPTALPSSTQTHHPPHAPRQSGSEPGCRRPETLKGLRPALLPRVPRHRALCRWEEAVSVQIQTPPPSPARWAAHMAALGLRVPARQCG